MNFKEMKSEEEDQISKMLGHNDTLRLVEEERCYTPSNTESWPPPSPASSIVEMPHAESQTTKRYCTQDQQYFNQRSRIENYNSPVSLSKSCCNSEMCLNKCTRNNNYRISSGNGTAALSPASRQLLYRRLCLFSILIAFTLGVLLGILIPFVYLTKDVMNQDSNSSRYQSFIVINKPVNLTSFPENSTTFHRDQYLRHNSSAERIFNHMEKKFDYLKSKLEFPTIHDVKYKNKVYNEKVNTSNAVKLNKPKKFSSVSFVEESDTGIAGVNQSPLNKDSLIKYLDLGVPNNTGDLFDDFGKKILESSLDEDAVEDDKKEKANDTILHTNIFWGNKIERALPNGFGSESNENWMKYVKSSSVIKMESGCGRMQNRLITFLDGTQACVRYRQNTDQIQGELFSFYLAQILQLPNLAPSLISVVNLTDPLWQNIAADIGSAQWNSNRPVVLTKYIPNLEAAHIPGLFKPSERHLNKFDILNIVKKGNVPEEAKSNEAKGNLLMKKITEGFFVDKGLELDVGENTIEEKSRLIKDFLNSLPQNEEKDSEEHLRANIGDALLDKFVELAQWSDLIIFDYLTANLDRIVNNLYNFQWNVNIMDAPAHNLARKVDSNLLLFLDNESGLLHGYRLLNKYEVYHSSLLDSLCVFRKSTAQIIKRLHEKGNVGDLLNKMFKDKNEANVLEILPPLPEKSIKILKERIARVAGKIATCEEQYGR